MNEPKNANTLSLEDARWMARQLQLAMFFGDEHDDENEEWDKNKEVNGADLVDRVCQLMDCLGLLPTDDDLVPRENEEA